MRRLFSILIIFVIVWIIGFKKINAYQFAGAEYQVIENTVTNDLGFGIKHRTDIGKSNLINTELDLQQVNVLEVPANEDVKIVTWSNLSPTRWSLSPVRAMANNYEVNNPGYKVIAAINGDNNFITVTFLILVVMNHYHLLLKEFIFLMVKTIKPLIMIKVVVVNQLALKMTDQNHH